jgi:hypothetical protein
MQRAVKVVLALAALVVLLPEVSFAQEGQIAGSVRDSSGAVMPGVLVEATSPALIEKVRSTTSDANGQYRLTNLPVGTYSITFTLEGFNKFQRDSIVLTSGFTAPINATMSVGQLAETVTVQAETPTVDVQSARETLVLTGSDLADLPTNRNVNSLLALTPGLTSGYAPGTLSGICSGGVGVFCNPGVTGFNVGDNNLTNMAQGRVMVDGQVINSGTAVPIVGQTGGYTADIANAQEVAIQISGAMGDSETGGASINIVPRTGGNRYAGNFFTSFTDDSFFSQNNGAYPGIPAVFQPVISDHDIIGSFGGPIKRDTLWFYSVARKQGIHKLPVGIDFWPNLWEGQWGYNYQPDRSQPRVEYKNLWRNVNARITYQATQKNKFNFFWDEQDFCQDPCLGVVSVFTSPESWWSVQAYPNRLQQASWTNPITNKILLEAGINITSQHYNTTEHREYTNPRTIPRVVEVGDTAGGDATAPRVNQFAGAGFFALTSGSLNSPMNDPFGGAELRDLDNYRTRASMSYVTGTHNAKFGYDGGFYSQIQTNEANDPRMLYNYVWPAADCANTNSCGNTSLQFPNNPTNTPLGPDGVAGTADDGRRPIPNNVVFNTGVGSLHDKVNYTALYAQDQWTLRRLTLNGAVRFDHATSSYGETCVGPDLYVPIQTNGQNFYCTPATDGVSFNDITPRIGVVWDVFGTGRTSVKWNMGKYLTAAGISGIYSNANPARRTVNTLARSWNDIDGDRIVDCDVTNPAVTPECGGFLFGNNDTTRFGRDPLGLDAAGTPIGLATTQCGRQEQGIPAAVQAYCAAYGDSMIEGWGKRQSEWQIGIGVQHELLPRLSAEVVYNRRSYFNLTTSDQLGIGCDRYNGAQDVRTCQEGNLNYTNPSYDFYAVPAPADPNLPNSGGYQVIGLSTPKTTLPFGPPTAQTLNPDLDYVWNGVDVNFVWRGPQGLRVNGGTQTSRSQRDTCFANLDAPAVSGRAGAEYQGGESPAGAFGIPPATPNGCKDITPWRTTVKGSAAYVVPWVDVLVSTIFQSFPGVERSAVMTFGKNQVIWGAGSENRATQPCLVPANGVGCLGSTGEQTTTIVNLLNNNELYGERVTSFDLKASKIIRFGSRRVTVGADLYNVFNSDAIQAYNNNYIPDNPATPANEQVWGQPMTLISPRFWRLSFSFDF